MNFKRNRNIGTGAAEAIVTNHPSRYTNAPQGKALAEKIMNGLAGRAGIRIGGEIL